MERTLSLPAARSSPPSAQLPLKSTLGAQIGQVVDFVAAEFRVPPAAICGPGKQYFPARRVALWLAFRLTDCAPAEVAVVFAGRHRTTIVHILAAVDARRERDDQFRRHTDRLLGTALRLQIGAGL